MGVIDEVPNYAKEVERLNSFRDWPVRWVTPQDLAANGFYHAGSGGDKVVCAYCWGGISGWERGDTPATEHRRLYPHCPFVKRQPVYNVPLGRTPSPDAEGNKSIFYTYNQPEEDTDTTDNKRDKMGPMVIEKPKSNKNMRFEKERLQSFTGWPKNLRQSPSDLAANGFYYLGKEDMCMCFHCRLIVSNWEPEDTPRGEHEKHKPDCKFIKGIPVGNKPLSNK